MRLTRRPREGKVINNLNVVSDGVAVLEFLRRKGPYAKATRPRDSARPQPSTKDGREVLAEIKEDPDLKRIPVVVITSSRAGRGCAADYNLHVNCYISKPVDLEQFIAVVQSIEDFWMGIVKLPPK